MSSTSSVLILGARGRLGLAAARAFAQAGWNVHAQVRPGASGPAVAGVQWLGVRPDDTAALAAWARGAQVVVQGLSPAYTHRAWRAELPGLTEAAIDVSGALGATLMLPASVYNFGAGMPSLLHEDTPQAPTTVKGQLRVATERQIAQATQDGAMKAVVIRAGDFFGGGTGTWPDLVMAKDLARGKFTHPGPLDIPTSWAYLPDLARVFVQVAQRRHQLPAFETLHFAGHALSGRDWASAIEAIAQEQAWLRPGAALRVDTLSWPLLRILALVMPTMASVCEMRYLWHTPYALANDRLLALIGEEPRTPFAVALRAALADLALLRTPVPAPATLALR